MGGAAGRLVGCVDSLSAQLARPLVAMAVMSFSIDSQNIFFLKVVVSGFPRGPTALNPLLEYLL